ncbi:unnamed protein product [Amoebophrya sp. A25]|nr:unnamed protein product [Amoebophrya sp. A25]|eukprot:GSA25T00001596001.1
MINGRKKPTSLVFGLPPSRSKEQDGAAAGPPGIHDEPGRRVGSTAAQHDGLVSIQHRAEVLRQKRQQALLDDDMRLRQLRAEEIRLEVGGVDDGGYGFFIPQDPYNKNAAPGVSRGKGDRGEASNTKRWNGAGYLQPQGTLNGVNVVDHEDELLMSSSGLDEDDDDDDCLIRDEIEDSFSYRQLPSHGAFEQQQTKTFRSPDSGGRLRPFRIPFSATDSCNDTSMVAPQPGPHQQPPGQEQDVGRRASNAFAPISRGGGGTRSSLLIEQPNDPQEQSSTSSSSSNAFPTTSTRSPISFSARRQQEQQPFPNTRTNHHRDLATTPNGKQEMGYQHDPPTPSSPSRPGSKKPNHVVRQLIGFEKLRNLVEERARHVKRKTAAAVTLEGALFLNAHSKAMNGLTSSSSSPSCSRGGTSSGTRRSAVDVFYSNLEKEAAQYGKAAQCETERVFQEAFAEIAKIQQKEAAIQQEDARRREAERRRKEALELEEEARRKKEAEEERQRQREQAARQEEEERARAEQEQRIRQEKQAAEEQRAKDQGAKSDAPPAVVPQESTSSIVAAPSAAAPAASTVVTAPVLPPSESLVLAPGASTAAVVGGSVIAPNEQDGHMLNPATLAEKAALLEEKLEPYSRSKEPLIKQKRLQLKKAVTSQIGKVSRQAPTTIACQDAMKQLLDQAEQPEAAQADPLFAEFVKYKIADGLCEQWSNIPARDCAAVWPFCYVMHRLCRIKKFRKPGGFRDVLLGMLHHRCPYTIPATEASVQSRNNGQEEEEAESAFFHRQTNLLRFYLGTLVLANDAGRLWTWVVTLLNHPPTGRFAPFALFIFLEVAGAFAMKRFGDQFTQKIYRDYIPRTFLPACTERLTVVGDKAEVTTKVAVIKTWLEACNKGEDMTPEGIVLQAHGESDIRDDI